MESEHRRFNPHFIKTGGLFCIFAGILGFGTLFYIVVVLGNLGLKVEMFDQTDAFLRWINKHQLAYTILWLINGLMAVFMLPVPLATSQVFKSRSHRSSSLTTASYLVGVCGFYLLIIASIIFYSVSPQTAKALVKNIDNSILIHEIFASLGMQFRLFGEFFIAAWLAGIGFHLVRRNRIDSFGWYTLALFGFTFIVIFGKSFNLFDMEPVLGILLYATFFWLGILLRQKAA